MFGLEVVEIVVEIESRNQGLRDCLGLFFLNFGNLRKNISDSFKVQLLFYYRIEQIYSGILKIIWSRSFINYLQFMVGVMVVNEFDIFF